MIEISKEVNKNYLCKIIKLKNLRKHSNADRLQIVSIDFQDVITGMDAKEGDIYVYFPVESKINKDFLSFTNSFRDKELNEDRNETGFFENNCRVKAVRLRGEKSMGYIVPLWEVSAWANHGTTKQDIEKYLNKEFDTFNGIKLVEKYQVKTRQENKSKQGKKPKLSRLIDGQVHLHTDTENLRKNIHKINPEDTISITYKTHGTSWWVSNVLVKKKLNWFEKLLSKFINIEDTEYDIIYGSRKVVKNQYEDNDKAKDHYFDYDLWADIKDKVKDSIPKGFTLYGEALGYTKTGSYIQSGYDYKVNPNEFKLEVYRITYTNSDGLVTELSYPQIKEFCDRVGLTTSHLFYYGKAWDFLHKDLQDIGSDEEFREVLIKQLEFKYNEKDCFMCNNKVPEKGIVLRKESLFDCEAYKLKSFRFLEYETKELDKGEENLEESN